MQIVIDIDEKIYEGSKHVPDYLRDDAWNAIANGTLLPDNATNGDMIKAMFPNAEYEVRECVVIFTFGGVKRELPIGWWNAPYKAESEE